jgi:ankyrin repeat protein
MGQTVFHRMAQHNTIVSFERFVDALREENGGTIPDEIHAPDLLLTTPLHYAVSSGHVKLAKSLLFHKADVNARTITGQAPIHMARPGSDMFSMLIAHNPNIDIRDNAGNNILHCAVYNKDVDAIHYLCGNKDSSWFVNPNIPNTTGYTPLMIAIMIGSSECVNALLKYNVDPNVTDHYGMFPLHLAVKTPSVSSVTIVKSLLDAGYEINKKTVRGKVYGENWQNYTALHIALKFGSHDSAKILISAGADIFIPGGPREITPLQCACTDLKSFKIIFTELINRAYFSMNSSHLYSSKQLQEHFNTRDTHGWSALHYAAFHGQKECIRLLLQAGATPFYLAPGPNLTQQSWVTVSEEEIEVSRIVSLAPLACKTEIANILRPYLRHDKGFQTDDSEGPNGDMRSLVDLASRGRNSSKDEFDKFPENFPRGSRPSFHSSHFEELTVQPLSQLISVVSKGSEQEEPARRNENLDEKNNACNWEIVSPLFHNKGMLVDSVSPATSGNNLSASVSSSASVTLNVRDNEESKNP